MPKLDESKKSAILFAVKRYSLHDGPGIRTTLFFKGCPLKCGWCHNPEGLSPDPELIYRLGRCIHCAACAAVCPEKALSIEDDAVLIDRNRCRISRCCTDACPSNALEIAGDSYSLEAVMEIIEQDIVFYDESEGGVTLSGGEPLMQFEFVEDLLRMCRNHYIHTALDTSGYIQTERLMSIAPFVKLFLYDLKIMDTVEHQKATGVGSELILENLKALDRADYSLIIRIPVIPGLNDNVDNMKQIGQFLSTLNHSYRIDLLPYHNLGEEKYKQLKKTSKFLNLNDISRDSLVKFQEILKDHSPEVIFGG
ncbi:hypothetical protein BVY01_04695 [bacterium I07]|nr:hypothetical protein BVY01_04695 [bacterium I07]